MTPQERNDAERAEFYRLTGEVIREWVELELFLSMWLVPLLGIDEFRSRIVWDSYTGFRSRLRFLESLIQNFADESLWAEAGEILKRVEVIASKRNMLAHAFGDLDARTNRLVFVIDKVDNEGTVNFVGSKTIDTANLRNWIRDINEARSTVHHLKLKLRTGVWQESLMHRRKLGEGK